MVVMVVVVVVVVVVLRGRCCERQFGENGTIELDRCTSLLA